MKSHQNPTKIPMKSPPNLAISSTPRIAPLRALLAGAGPHEIGRAAGGAAATDSGPREAEVATTTEEAPLLGHTGDFSWITMVYYGLLWFTMVLLWFYYGLLGFTMVL